MISARSVILLRGAPVAVLLVLRTQFSRRPGHFLSACDER